MVGRRLVRALRADGIRVRGLVRDLVRARSILGLDVELVEADLGSDVDLSAAMAGVDVAYFLVHMLGSGPDYAAREEVAAARFAAAASEAGVGRVIYLGGLGPDEGGSPHLDSRHHTAEALRELGPPLTYFRAAMIVGPGASPTSCCARSPASCRPCPSPPGCAPRPSRSGSATSSPTCATRRRVPESAGREIQIGGPDVMQHLDVIARFSQETGRRAALRIRFRTGSPAPTWSPPGPPASPRAPPRSPPSSAAGCVTTRASPIPPGRAFSRSSPSPSTWRSSAPWPRTRGATMGDVIAQSIEIDAPIERVWDLVMDPERLGDWVTIHRSVAEVPDGELTTGSRFRQEMRLKGIPLKVRWEVVECRPPRHARWQGKAAAGAEARISYELSEDGTGPGSTTRTSSSCRRGRRQARRPGLQCDLRGSRGEADACPAQGVAGEWRHDR